MADIHVWRHCKVRILSKCIQFYDTFSFAPGVCVHLKFHLPAPEAQPQLLLLSFSFSFSPLFFMFILFLSFVLCVQLLRRYSP